VPAKTPFQEVEERWGHPSEIPFLYVMVLYIVSNAIREDVLDLHLLDVKTVPL